MMYYLFYEIWQSGFENKNNFAVSILIGWHEIFFFKFTTNLTNSFLMAAAEEAIIDSSLLFISFILSHL